MQLGWSAEGWWGRSDLQNIRGDL